MSETVVRLTTGASARTPSDDVLDSIRGRIRDVDSHEMFSARLWVQEYGEVVEPLARYFIETQPDFVPNSFSVDRVTDDEPFTSEDLRTCWGRGCHAPGAFSMHRRLEFMDAAGIAESLVFGSIMSFIGQQFASEGGEIMQARMGGALSVGDPLTFGKAMVRAHNDWCIRVAQISPRLWPVASILTHSLDDAVAECERVMSGGVRTIVLPAGVPIEGRAPAHPDNDILWKICADNDVSVMLHIGGEKPFLREQVAWSNAPLFTAKNNVPSELPIDPASLATCSLAAQNYVTNMVLGAVFERIPNLRFGVMELGGFWIGPTAENLDMWADQFARRFANVLSMKPSEYIHRNIRVTPFNFEPVDKYIDRFPYLEDVYCFSTDYPHHEGGMEPISTMAARVKRLGDDVAEKFFVTNAEWVMPSA